MSTATSQPKYTFFSTVGLATLLGITGALIYFVILKNQQIETARAIEETEDRVAMAIDDIRMVELDKNRLLNRFALNQRLKQQNSRLQPINFEVVETLRTPTSTSDEHFATIEP